MKRLLFVVPIICLLLVITIDSAFAEEKEKKDSILQELSHEFSKAGVKKDDMEAVNNSVKNLLAKGATRAEIQEFIASAKKTGLSSEEMADALNVMSELVNEVVKPKAAGGLVSQAAHDARAKGLKGKDLAAKVQETIEQKKRDYYELMKRKDKQKKNNKSKEKKGKNKGETDQQ
jgi:hypothetical protein